MTERPPGLEVESAPLGRAPGVVVRGEVDITASAELTATLDAAIRDSRGAFVLDLCNVSFMDSSGINALLRARSLLGRSERTLVIVCPPGPARRLLDIAGITELLALFDSREEAAASLLPTC